MSTRIDHLLEEMRQAKPRSMVLYERVLSKGRHRTARSGHTYTPPETVAFENYVALEGQKVFKSPFTCPVKVSINIIEPTPASFGQAELYMAKVGLIVPSKGDLDNKVKAITDGLNGIAYTDDKLICTIVASRRYGDNYECRVVVSQDGFTPYQVDQAKRLLK